MTIEGGRPPWTPEKPATEPPLFRVLKGSPTDEELAAVIAVLMAQRQSAPPAPPTTTTSGWSAYWRGVRPTLTPGRGAWRASGRDR